MRQSLYLRIIIGFWVLIFPIQILLGENIKDPAEYIDADPEIVYQNWGVPDELTALRGQKQEWDTVVFYKEGYYLFFVQNKVWQVRFDKSFEGNWNGIAIGALFPVVDGILGQPKVMSDKSRIYSLEGYAVPIQVRCYFSDDRLADVYIYRSNGL